MPTNSWGIAAAIVFLTILAAVPLFSVLAYREWLRGPRYELTAWRNILGALSTGAIFFGWLGYACAIIMSLTSFRYSWGEELFGVVLVLTLTGFCSSFAWKGKARYRAVTAACLMMAVCVWFYATGSMSA